MTGPAAVAVLMAVAVLTVGLPLEIYALLTRERRAMMREIRRNAEQNGWRFQKRRWTGDPTAFVIDGRTAAGLEWSVKTGGTSDNSQGWAVRMTLQFPKLAGVMDFVMFPRDPNDHRLVQMVSAIPQAVRERIGQWSGVAAGAMDFVRTAVERPTGWPGFDAVYEVMAQPTRVGRAPIDPSLAQKMTQWPEEAVAPKAMLAWRDANGLHLELHLPGPVNWQTVGHALEAGELLSARLPSGEAPLTPPRIVDKLIGQI